jgi:menaquinone-dependent protoporphyrinogen oxidase
MTGEVSKVMVVYGTKSGCTAGVAEKIGETLVDAGLTVDVVPAEEASDPGAYDAVVVGSGIRVGTWHASTRTWVADHAAALKTRPVAFFTCGLRMSEGEEFAEETRGYTDALIEETGVVPVALGLFAGWNEPKTFTLVERLVMKAMKANQGDFRDFEAVAAWSRETAAALAAGPVAGGESS